MPAAHTYSGWHDQVFERRLQAAVVADLEQRGLVDILMED
jgi:hypothetical protein